MCARVAVLCVLLGAGCQIDVDIGRGDRSAAPERELRMVAHPGNVGWSVVFTGLAEEPERFRIKVGDEDFSEYRRGVMSLPADTPACRITVHYVQGGKEHGPFHFDFDPKTATLEFSKDSLDMVRTSWVTWRDWGDRVKVYFTPLHMHTCALKKVEYGFDGALDQEWALPPCRGPSAGIGDEPTTLDAPPDATTISVRLTFIDGEQTEIQHIPKPTRSR